VTDWSDEDELEWSSQWLPVSGEPEDDEPARVIPELLALFNRPRLQLDDPVIDPPGPFQYCDDTFTEDPATLPPDDEITGYPDHYVVNGDHSSCFCEQGQAERQVELPDCGC